MTINNEKYSLIYYTISIVMGIFFSFLVANRFYFIAAMAALFFISILVLSLKKLSFFMMIFFVFGILNLYIFFNIKVSSTIIVRIKQCNGYYTIANYEGRNISLIGNTDGLEQGMKVYINGHFERDINYTYGSIGKFQVNKYKTKSDLLYYICSYKNKVYKKLIEDIGESRAAIINSICYGDKKDINPYDKELLKNLGISHILSISGFHMALFYSFFEKFTGFYGGFFLSVLYILITGGKSSSIRAFIMIFILKLSKKRDKKYNPLISLALSYMIILLIKPYMLFDVGTTISYLAVLGIIFFNKKIKYYLYFLNRKLINSVSVCLSTQILTIPYIAIVFNELNLGFLIGNMLLIPFYSLLIYLGFLFLILFKLPILFNFNIRITKILFIFIEFIQYNIFKINPNIFAIDGIYVILIIISLMILFLCKKGKISKKIYIIYVIGVITYNFNVVPKINYVSKIYIIDYGYTREIITDYDITDYDEILECINKYKPTIVTTNLNKMYYKKIFPCGKIYIVKQNNKLKLVMYYYNKKIKEITI
ncbi:MAG: ComEC/Rec2 family competence protein [Clostridiaceae bacterium]